jgi:hypothetical protein
VSAFKALRVIINGIDETLTLCGKVLHLNKDIFLYKDLTLKPGETKTVLGNMNEKNGGISLTDKIADPKKAIRKTAKAKKEIEIPKETIIAGIEEHKYPKLEISNRKYPNIMNKETIRHAVLQKKKDGKTRFICDFRHMGPETCEKYQHPFLLIQEILDNLR